MKSSKNLAVIKIIITFSFDCEHFDKFEIDSSLMKAQ